MYLPLLVYDFCSAVSETKECICHVIKTLHCVCDFIRHGKPGNMPFAARSDQYDASFKFSQREVIRLVIRLSIKRIPATGFGAHSGKLFCLLPHNAVVIS